jgi:hypothetical protein
MRPAIATIPVALIFSAALTACGASGAAKTEDPVTRSSSVQTDFTTVLGCQTVTEQSTEEIFVQKLFTCPAAIGALYVYTFTNAKAQASWRSLAETTGSVVENQGTDWIAVKS